MGCKDSVKSSIVNFLEIEVTSKLFMYSSRYILDDRMIITVKLVT